MLKAFATFQRWVLYGVQMDVVVAEDFTIGLFGDEVHTVGNALDRHLGSASARVERA